MRVQIGNPVFKLGSLYTTPGALAHLDAHQLPPMQLIVRHMNGDWGDLSDADQMANHRAVIEGSRILSAYIVGEVKIYVITEADRSSTTILLASEY